MASTKHRGRPRLDEDDTSTVLSIRLPSTLYDDAHRLAKSERTNVPDLVRKAIHYSVRAGSTRPDE